MNLGDWTGRFRREPTAEEFVMEKNLFSKIPELY